MGAYCTFLRVPVRTGEIGVSDRSVRLDERISQGAAMLVKSQDHQQVC